MAFQFVLGREPAEWERDLARDPLVVGTVEESTQLTVVDAAGLCA